MIRCGEPAAPTELPASHVPCVGLAGFSVFCQCLVMQKDQQDVNVVQVALGGRKVNGMSDLKSMATGYSTF